MEQIDFTPKICDIYLEPLCSHYKRLSERRKGEPCHYYSSHHVVCPYADQFRIICPFADGWTNKEGWFVDHQGRLVCADFDDYCSLCRTDDSKDFEFDVKV